MAVYLGIDNDGTFVTSDGYMLKDSNNLSLYALPMATKSKIVLNGVVYNVILNLNKRSE